MASDMISVKTLTLAVKEALRGEAHGVAKLFALTASVGVGAYLLRIVKESAYASTPPGSLGLPLLGETLSFVLDPKGFVKRRKAKHGPIFKTHILFSPAIYLDGHHAKLLFRNTYIGWPSNWNELLGPHSMAAISGPRHKFQRSVASSAFQSAALKSYLPVLQEVTMKHLSDWAESTKGSRDPEPEIQLYTFEVAEKILLGTANVSNDLLGALDAFKTWLNAYQALLPLNLPWTAHGKGMRARTKLMKYYQSVIDQKRAKPLSEASDMLTNVMNARENGQPMTDPELLDFCLVMMFAGHDTTKCSIQSILYYLEKYPEVCKELETEVHGIWDGKSPILWEMVERAQTGKCGRFVNEVLRIKAPVPALYRVAQEDIKYEGFTIPKGWKLITSPIVQHEQVSIKQEIDLTIDHSSFREDQFSPFGGGSRKCIGYNFAKVELTVWLMCLLRHFEVKVDLNQAREMTVPFIFYKVSGEFARRK
eukprot:TRINITY_DN19252_c0_g1_i1.p1 TRINITY_DN19252_c0_g1~~TRINITY_DN19252_c0_g1_i1.p1  ORF type:complete len:505 (-),score=72.86 TRINITY_DN19252_c0_g1_i1:164-1600(-)